jgi:hypothetical protein
MDESVERLRRELASLPPRRGVHTGQISARIGPMLRGRAGIMVNDDDEACREKLIAWLGHILPTLPAREQLVLTAALGLHAETRDLSALTGRLHWVAVQQGRDIKTVRRWLETAETRMAKVAIRQTDDSDDSGWYVASLVTHVLLDRPSPVAQEVREIVAIRNGLRRITHRLSLPRSPGAARTAPRLDVTLDYGGRLALAHASATDFRYVITLAKPLNLYDRHRYQLTVRVPTGQAMSPYYVCVPQHPIQAFDLLVRFDPARVPTEVRRVDDASPRSVDDRVPGDAVLVNEMGEVRVDFRRLRQGRSYGLQWDWPGSAP